MSANVLVLDHKDSFVFILAEQFKKLGARVRTYRSDLPLEAWRRIVAAAAPDLVVLSPGPGRPEGAGVTVPWLATRPALPLLGICLGHQAMGYATGAEVVRAPRPVHGRASRVDLLDDPLFAGPGGARGFGGSLAVARYHSLVVRRPGDEWQILATLPGAAGAGEPLVMAMRHRELPWLGFQFHPESFLTPFGGVLVARVLEEAVAWTRRAGGAGSAAGAPAGGAAP